MRLKIDFDEPIIQENDVMKIQPSDLDDFYVAEDNSNNSDKTNLFFVLLTSFHYYLDKGEQKMQHI